MYQYWFFAFKTAKHWGRGPRDWHADILGFHNQVTQPAFSMSPPDYSSTHVTSPISHSSSGNHELTKLGPDLTVTRPSDLCRWSIHYRTPAYQELPSPPIFEPENIDMDDESRWPIWSDSHSAEQYVEKLSDNIEHNSFSNIHRDDLPLAMNQIVKAVQRSPEEILIESIGFSIMSRNAELLVKLLRRQRKLTKSNLDQYGIYPFHLAISYLDGARSCCTVLDAIMEYDPRALRKLYVNDLGHTVLDQLMMTILKAHSACSPGLVDSIFQNEKRFQGEEVDVCGRWDADSACVRELLSKGDAGIPFEWKHAFCHTSAQAICHGIGTIFGPHWGPDISTPSGLFVRRCSHCGLKLELLPLHTLVVVGFQLSISGCQCETLFGILACVICLLHNGANPCTKADVSPSAILGLEESSDCEHECFSASQFAKRMIALLPPTISSELRVTWQVIYHAFKTSQIQWEPTQIRSRGNTNNDDVFTAFVDYSEDETESMSSVAHEPAVPTDCYGNEMDPEDGFAHDTFFGESEALGTLWATIQTELLTYRRLEEGDPWISDNFSMLAVCDGLRNGGRISIPFVDKGMMKPFCRCGRFEGAAPACATIDDAAAYHFANLDDWGRSTFLDNMEDRWNDWD